MEQVQWLGHQAALGATATPVFPISPGDTLTF